MGRHAGAVDAAEGTVWAESIRARALALADAVQRVVDEDRPGYHHALFARIEDLLREIAGAP